MATLLARYFFALYQLYSHNCWIAGKHYYNLYKQLHVDMCVWHTGELYIGVWLALFILLGRTNIVIPLMFIKGLHDLLSFELIIANIINNLLELSVLYIGRA